MENRLLRRTVDTEIGEYIERICQYPKYKEGDAPCNGCVKRTACNHDIFSGNPKSLVENVICI